jgi:bifunctional non-homologous end joining protein LigD
LVTLAPAADPGHPAELMFALDSPDRAELALLMRGMFQQLGLESLAKTDGAGGVHVHVPLNSGATHEQTQAFARQVAETLQQRWPKPAGIDWSPNERGARTICAYSLRAGARPAVATPLTWEEVEAGDLDHDHASVIARVADHGDLFAPVLTLVQSLPG